MDSSDVEPQAWDRTEGSLVFETSSRAPEDLCFRRLPPQKNLMEVQGGGSGECQIVIVLKLLVIFPPRWSFDKGNKQKKMGSMILMAKERIRCNTESWRLLRSGSSTSQCSGEGTECSSLWGTDRCYQCEDALPCDRSADTLEDSAGPVPLSILHKPPLGFDVEYLIILSGSWRKSHKLLWMSARQWERVMDCRPTVWSFLYQESCVCKPQPWTKKKKLLFFFNLWQRKLIKPVSNRLCHFRKSKAFHGWCNRKSVLTYADSGVRRATCISLLLRPQSQAKFAVCLTLLPCWTI